jgi:O-antigen/teichoic acid export membrane protein
MGNVVYAGTQWAMLALLARLGSPEMVGHFALGLAVTAPIVLFTNLQLRAVQATDARGLYGFGDYLALRLVSSTVALLVIVGIAMAFGYEWEAGLVILVLGIAKAFESISDVFYGFLQQRERMDLIAKSMILRGTAALAVMFVIVYTTRHLVWGVVGLAISWGLSLLCYDVPKSRDILESFRHGRFRPRWNPPVLWSLTRIALPLGFVTLLISLNTNAPRYFVEQHLGGYQLGIFAAVAYLAVAGTHVINAIGQAVIPRMAKLYAAGLRKDFVALLGKLSGIGIVLGILTILLARLFGEQFLRILYGADYAQADLFVSLALAAAIAYLASILGYGITAARYFAVQAPMLAATLAVTTIACSRLIPSQGLQGAATAVLLGFVVQLILSLAIISHALLGLRHKDDDLEPGRL